jgi:hypothetical protein
MRNPWIIALALFSGISLCWAGAKAASAQEGDVPSPEPQSIVDEVTTSEGGYIDDRSAVAPVRAMRYHPAPAYARGRRGRRAAETHQWNMAQASGLPWHGNYYNAQYGAPVALVVPPTAGYITNYSWGVGNTSSTPIYHQFARPYPGAASGSKGGSFHATPLWPSNTNQFGYYPVRGPW